jgi:YebC/PmpR family DNA-binding regulatory protein
MAGHSKWKNIRIRKEKQDALRGKLFTKLSREIIVATRMGGGDPTSNPRLRMAIEKAREYSLPSENIKRSIQRGTGEIEGADYEEILYEGYGPGGAAILVECYTENRNRTVADLRHTFSKHGGNLSESGSVSWQFKHMGQISIPKDSLEEETLTLKALDAGAEDVVSEDNVYNVYTTLESLHSTNEVLISSGIKSEEADLVWVPVNKAELNETEMRKLVKLLNALEDLDDVKDTYVNVDIPEEIMEG